MISSFSTKICFFVAITMALYGCVEKYHRPMPTVLAGKQTAIVRSIIEQEDVKLAVPGSNIANFFQGSTLIDLAMQPLARDIDRAVTEKRERAAEAHIDPLRRLTEETDFRDNYWREFETELKNSSWLTTTRFEKKFKYFKIPGRDTNYLAHPQEIKERFPGGNLLTSSTRYSLTVNGSSLVVQTNVLYFLEGSKSPVYRTYYLYFSDWHGGKDKNANISYWAANQAKMYKEAIREAAHETMTMFSIDFLQDRNSSNPDQRLSKRMIRKQGNRFIWRACDGRLMSVGPRVNRSLEKYRCRGN